MINPRPNTSLPHFGAMFWQMISSQILENTKQGPILSEQAILSDLANLRTLPAITLLIFIDKVHSVLPAPSLFFL
jgi:hypothetical protein